MPRTTTPCPTRLALTWHRCFERFRLASLAIQDGPESQHLALALDRATDRLVDAREALLAGLDTLPAAIALDDVLVVVAPDEAVASTPRDTWTHADLIVSTIPREAIRWACW